MLQIWNDTRQEGRLYPERFSHPYEKFSVSLFVISNPSVDCFLGNITNGWEFIINTAKAREKESNQFLLLLDGKNIGSFFNFQERTHQMSILSKPAFVESDIVESDWKMNSAILCTGHWTMKT